jgi:hypothetical protein
MGFVSNKSSILVPPDGKYMVRMGEREYLLKIVSNKKGANLIFNQEVEEIKDIVFIDKAS